MNAASLVLSPTREAARPRRAPDRRRTTPSIPVRYRAAVSGEAPALLALIDAHRDEGHLLPRHFDELSQRAQRFVVAARGRRIIGCAELVPLSHQVAEVRSLVVDSSVRSRGVGKRLLAEVEARASAAGFERLCAFTHDASYFVHLGFSLVPHASVPEKIAADCVACDLFRRCSQQAVLVHLTGSCD